MWFKQRFNCYFRELGSYRNGTRLELERDQFAEYLDTIDREVARALLGTKEIPLDFSGWRLRELDRWKWISEKETFVGCLTELGVFVVLKYEKPLLKKRPPGSQSR